MADVDLLNPRKNTGLKENCPLGQVPVTVRGLILGDIVWATAPLAKDR